MAAVSPCSDSPLMGFCCISQQPKGYSCTFALRFTLPGDPLAFGRPILVLVILGRLATAGSPRKSHLDCETSRWVDSEAIAAFTCKGGLSVPGLKSLKSLKSQAPRAVQAQDVHGKGRVDDVLGARVGPFGAALHEPWRVKFSLRSNGFGGRAGGTQRHGPPWTSHCQRPPLCPADASSLSLP